MHTLTPTETNNSTTQPPTRRQFGQWWLSLAVWLLIFLLLPISGHSQSKTALTVGLTSTNWHQQLTAGFTVRHNAHYATMSAVDVGYGVMATQVQPALLFELDPCCIIGFMLGPEFVVYQEFPTIEEKLTYLNAATGTFLWLNITEKVSAIAAAEYIHSDADLSRFKLRIQFAFWLHE